MSSNVLSVLASISASTQSMSQQVQLQNIQNDMQKQLQAKIASIQAPVDQVSINYSQQQITSLTAQSASVSKFETTFGTNNSHLADIANQLNLMNKAVMNGDSTGYDNALAAANTDLDNSAVPSWNTLFQDTGIAALKKNGLGVGSSSSYDLSTPDGQAAATAAITAVQNTVQQVLRMNGTNQNIAASEAQAINGKINALQSVQMQQQMENTAALATQTQTLKTNMDNEIHIIQLNMGQGSSAVATLAAALASTATAASATKPTLFQTLQSQVGMTASDAEQSLNSSTGLSALSVLA